MTDDFLSRMAKDKISLPGPDEVLPGREQPVRISGVHHVTGRKLIGPFPEGFQTFLVGMGCFWGAERLFWELDGVHVTAVGYAGGHTKNPTYEEVCSGRTGHAEVVLVVFDPAKIAFEELLRVFFERHDPTQGMRQGNDLGTQYRSCLFVEDPKLRAIAERVRDGYQRCLTAAGRGEVTTEVGEAPPFYYAEEYHQQYLSKNPAGYCGLKGTGVSCATLDG